MGSASDETNSAIARRLSNLVPVGTGGLHAIAQELASCAERGGAFACLVYFVDGDGSVEALDVSSGLIGHDDVASCFGQFALVEAVMTHGSTRDLQLAPGWHEDPDGVALLTAAGAESGLIVPLTPLTPLTQRSVALGAVVMLARGRRIDADEEWRMAAEGMCRRVAQGRALHQALEQREARAGDAAESSGEWRALVESLPTGVLRLDERGVVRFVNRRVPCAALAVGDPWTELGVPSDRGRMQAALERVVSTGEAAQLELQSADGWISCHIGPIRDGAPGAMVLARDITEQKRAEARLLVADRIAALGMLAASIAHELNSPLACVLANLEILAADATAESEELQDARTAAARIRDVVLDLKLFGRGDLDAVQTRVDMRAVVESALRIADNDLRHRARVVCDFGATPGVMGSESGLRQVILGTLLNASQAIDPGAAASHEIRVSTEATPDGGVLVRVRDTGRPPPRDSRPGSRLPEAPTPSGDSWDELGLNLTSARNVVASLGGRIAVARGADGWNETSIWLPGVVVDHPASAGHVTAPEEPRAKILVIDDEPLIGRAVTRTLRRHDVTSLTSAHDALDLIRSGQSFDLIFCDLMMPQMTGMDFHTALQALAPEQTDRVVFLSGGAFTPRATEFMSRVKNDRIDKPFDTESMRSLVGRLLERGK